MPAPHCPHHSRRKSGGPFSILTAFPRGQALASRAPEGQGSFTVQSRPSTRSGVWDSVTGKPSIDT